MSRATASQTTPPVDTRQSSETSAGGREAASKRLLGLPSVARLAMFARRPGSAVLLTTSDRAQLFLDSGVFGASRTLDPHLSDWHERSEKVVLTLEQAVKAFPVDPAGSTLELAVGGNYPRAELQETLANYGYARDELPGYSVRGDTLTLFRGSDPEQDAVKLEFFGDELDSLSCGEKALERYVLAPLPGSDAEDATSWPDRLIEKLPGPVFVDSPELVSGELGEERGAWLWGHLRQREVISFGRDPLELEVGPAPVEALGYYRGRLSELTADVEGWLKDGFSVSILLKFERSGRYLRERVIDQLESRWANRVERHPGVVGLVLAPGAAGGYRDDEAGEIVLTEELLYGAQGGRKLKRLPGRSVQDAAQLSVGDYLIHPDHGIGRFQGLEPRQVVGVTRDYLILRYAGEGKLYLPVEQLPLLRRHPGTTDDPPRLSTLGTNEWARARERARASAQELAAKLIKTYAQRQVTPGVALPPVPDWDRLIAENFPFNLTPDQAQAVETTLADMASPVPMDRLISGDVGFGKTEVAIRAAHRAVGNGKQVAMLVPTTVLAKQHHETIAERFRDLPVQVRMLSRFTSDREATDTVRGLADGSVDIVVGTHRLLSDAVVFKDLGLLVIDEEHRFGVGQKERLKSLRANLDVLSLSATPIPRTLYMSLVGLRDVSQIMTPPEGRKPIQTLLQPYDPVAVREAVLFELERGGKTYYIHDRIGSMGMRARTLQQLVPEARIGVAHGQMDADALEEVMIAFEDGGFDVLLATTIVESGLDISGANTLIIERADRLGLAQLYQLRGRVGRRQTEAWAHLFYPGRLTEQAQRRLYAIAELNDLGSGHLLAEKDMEIRGVGNLLGPEQHGQIAAVSLEVYTEMLAEEIAKLKGEQKAAERPAVAVDLNLDARLSPAYIQDDDQRIAFYGRFAETDSLAEVGRIARELREAYGPYPPEVKAFVELVKLRLLAGERGVVSIKEHMTDVEIAFGGESVDYDARRVRELPFSVEPTRYPPGFSVKKRGMAAGDIPAAISSVLYACG
jgi:transcription-repair coupling factor (superfamily II helicase)